MSHKDTYIFEVQNCCSTCTGDAKDNLKQRILEMGFKEVQISFAIKRCGLRSCSGQEGCVCLQESIYHLVDFINAHLGDNEEREQLDSSTQNGKVCSKKQLLSDMGYRMNEICHAIEICGDDSDFEVLVDFIYATYGHKKESKVLDFNVHAMKPQSSSGLANVNMASDSKTNDENFNVPFTHKWSSTSSESSEDEMDLRWSGAACQEMDMGWTGGASFSGVVSKRNMKRKHKIEEVQKLDDENDVCDKAFYTSPECPSLLRGSRGMCGFSLPGSFVVKARTISTVMKGPPFFYFENVALMPKCEWDTIIRFFNGIEPEFVDSIHFSACHRQRGYVHNLPLEGREVSLPKPPMTIEEAFPRKDKFRPSWDTRTKMNCINTVRSSDTICRKIADTLLKYENDPPWHEQKILLSKLKKFNLLWVNPGRVAPLEPVEMEILLGFEEEHTRGSSSMTERYKALGNSFQVDTVAYHLSALRAMYCDGIKVLSLFSGIGGAEVALHKAGIPLKLVVSVEGNPKRRDVLESWWKRTGQRGRLLHRDNVEALDHNVLHELSKKFGGFDLVIGGSPCNNLTGSNRVTRVGLEGEHSRLFFEFPRIYNLVKQFQDQGDIADVYK